MYTVQDREFDDFVEACQYCRENPLSTVVNDCGETLMIHERVSEDEALDIRMIQILLQIQEITGNPCSQYSHSSSHSGFGLTSSSLFYC